MKLFTDPQGKFQMYMPLELQYKNPSLKYKEGEPHAFGLYYEDHADDESAFQISCKQTNPSIQQVIDGRKLEIQQAGTKKIDFTESYVHSGDMQAHSWMAAVEDHFVLVTFIYPDGDKRAQEKGLPMVKASLEKFKFIKPEFREIVLKNRRYDLFMASMAAVIDLRNLALEKGSFIELVALNANLIDAQLRLALILSEQLENGNTDIDVGLLFQSEGDKVVMERAIYAKALQKGIIDQKIFDELELLYKERNKVIHRYIITDLRTEDVIKIVFRYYRLEEEIGLLVNALEQQQFKDKVGLHALKEPGPMSEMDIEKIKRAVKDKHGHIVWGESTTKGS